MWIIVSIVNFNYFACGISIRFEIYKYNSFLLVQILQDKLLLWSSNPYQMILKNNYYDRHFIRVLYCFKDFPYWICLYCKHNLTKIISLFCTVCNILFRVRVRQKQLRQGKLCYCKFCNVEHFGLLKEIHTKPKQNTKQCAIFTTNFFGSCIFGHYLLHIS